MGGREKTGKWEHFISGYLWFSSYSIRGIHCAFRSITPPPHTTLGFNDTKRYFLKAFFIIKSLIFSQLPSSHKVFLSGFITLKIVTFCILRSVSVKFISEAWFFNYLCSMVWSGSGQFGTETITTLAEHEGLCRWGSWGGLLVGHSTLRCYQIQVIPCVFWRY